ncbi:hypothetical protein CQZ98_05515 [Pseudomonas sp. MYb115]|nr:hypothetical protein CQZ98_05515 [Pseudomonas sp. MYb115]
MPARQACIGDMAPMIFYRLLRVLQALRMCLRMPPEPLQHRAWQRIGDALARDAATLYLQQ